MTQGRFGYARHEGRNLRCSVTGIPVLGITNVASAEVAEWTVAVIADPPREPSGTLTMNTNGECNSSYIDRNEFKFPDSKENGAVNWKFPVVAGLPDYFYGDEGETYPNCVLTHTAELWTSDTMGTGTVEIAFGHPSVVKIPFKMNFGNRDVETSENGGPAPPPAGDVVEVVLIVLAFAAAIGVSLLLLWIIPRAIARAAVRKGRNFWPWFWIGLFFPIPAAIIVAIMSPSTPSAIQTAPMGVAFGEPTKRCPQCGEEILAIAKQCKHCGEQLSDT